MSQTILTHPTVKTPIIPLRAVSDPPVCAECRFAQVFAVQDRAKCTHPTAALAGRVVPAASRPCGDFVADTRGLDLCAYRHRGKLLAP
jgi:hypothetical protein